MDHFSRGRDAALWGTVAILALATVLYTYLQLPPEEPVSAAFFRRTTFVGLLGTGLLMGVLDPLRRVRWALAVGLFPLVGTVIYMVVRGPGNIWPIALALAAFMGLVPGFGGAFAGSWIRRLVTRNAGHS